MRSSPFCFSSGSPRSKRHNPQTDDEETVAALALGKIESRIAATPAEGLRGLVVKLGLQRFLHEHADGSANKLIPPTLIWYV